MTDNRNTYESDGTAGIESEIPRNYSFLFYDHPVYSSNLIYGIERNAEEEAMDERKETADEPVESWGWVNNVDRTF